MLLIFLIAAPSSKQMMLILEAILTKLTSNGINMLSHKKKEYEHISISEITTQLGLEQYGYLLVDRVLSIAKENKIVDIKSKRDCEFNITPGKSKRYKFTIEGLTKMFESKMKSKAVNKAFNTKELELLRYIMFEMIDIKTR